MEGDHTVRLAPASRSLSVVIPAFNESAGIDWAIRATRASLAGLLEGRVVVAAEIVIVDDHSSDDTGEQVVRAGELPGPAVRLVRARGPQGLGAAVRRGLAEATGDLVVYTDADLPFDPAELGRLVGVLDRYEADVLCGFRLDRSAEGFRRTVQSYAFNLLARTVLPITARDVNFACKVFTRPALEKLLPELRSVGPFIDAELMARCAQHHLHLVQTGVDYFPRVDGASTLGGPAAVASILREGSSMVRELRARP